MDELHQDLPLQPPLIDDSVSNATLSAQHSLASLDSLVSSARTEGSEGGAAVQAESGSIASSRRSSTTSRQSSITSIPQEETMMEIQQQEEVRRHEVDAVTSTTNEHTSISAAAAAAAVPSSIDSSSSLLLTLQSELESARATILTLQSHISSSVTSHDTSITRAIEQERSERDKRLRVLQQSHTHSIRQLQDDMLLSFEKRFSAYQAAQVDHVLLKQCKMREGQVKELATQLALQEMVMAVLRNELAATAAVTTANASTNVTTTSSGATTSTITTPKHSTPPTPSSKLSSQLSSTSTLEYHLLQKQHSDLSHTLTLTQDLLTSSLDRIKEHDTLRAQDRDEFKKQYEELEKDTIRMRMIAQASFHHLLTQYHTANTHWTHERNEFIATIRKKDDSLFKSDDSISRLLHENSQLLKSLQNLGVFSMGTQTYTENAQRILNERKVRMEQQAKEQQQQQMQQQQQQQPILTTQNHPTVTKRSSLVSSSPPPPSLSPPPSAPSTSNTSMPARFSDANFRSIHSESDLPDLPDLTQDPFMFAQQCEILISEEELEKEVEKARGERQREVEEMQREQMMLEQQEEDELHPHHPPHHHTGSSSESTPHSPFRQSSFLSSAGSVSYSLSGSGSGISTPQQISSLGLQRKASTISSSSANMSTTASRTQSQGQLRSGSLLRREGSGGSEMVGNGRNSMHRKESIPNDVAQQQMLQQQHQQQHQQHPHHHPHTSSSHAISYTRVMRPDEEKEMYYDEGQENENETFEEQYHDDTIDDDATSPFIDDPNNDEKTPLPPGIDPNAIIGTLNKKISWQYIDTTPTVNSTEHSHRSGQQHPHVSHSGSTSSHFHSSPTDSHSSLLSSELVSGMSQEWRTYTAYKTGKELDEDGSKRKERRRRKEEERRKWEEEERRKKEWQEEERRAMEQQQQNQATAHAHVTTVHIVSPALILPVPLQSPEERHTHRASSPPTVRRGGISATTAPPSSSVHPPIHLPLSNMTPLRNGLSKRANDLISNAIQAGVNVTTLSAKQQIQQQQQEMAGYQQQQQQHQLRVASPVQPTPPTHPFVNNSISVAGATSDRSPHHPQYPQQQQHAVRDRMRDLRGKRIKSVNAQTHLAALPMAVSLPPPVPRCDSPSFDTSPLSIDAADSDSPHVDIDGNDAAQNSFVEEQ